MKYKLITFLFAGLAFLTQPCCAQVDSSCPPPHDYNFNGIGPFIPPYYDMMQSLSPNGKSLAYLVDEGDVGAHILNLETLADTLIQVQGGLPGEEDISWTGITWCPYDSNLIALNVVSFVDTTNSGTSSVYVNNIFTYRISTGESKLITPQIVGRYGSATIAGGEIGSQSCWLPGSTSVSDSLLIGFGGIHGKDTGFYGIYVPQTQTLIPLTWPDTIHFKGNISPNGLDTLTNEYIGITTGFPNAYFLNGTQFMFPRGIDTGTSSNWAFSRDSKLLVIEITPYLGDLLADTVFPQVWVYKTSDPTKAIDVINFQQLYCKYSLDGIWPLFITDSTLAVSMHHDSDLISPLWEITIDGRIIRQLTFLHTGSSVVKSAPNTSVASLHVFPNPATDELQILGGQTGTVHLFDIMGRERMTANDDGTGATLDVSRLEAGTYFLRLGNQSAKVEVTH